MQERSRPGPSVCRLRSCAWLLVLAAWGTSEVEAQRAARAQFSRPREVVAQRALRVPVGAQLRLVGVPLEARTAALDLRRFEVFTPDARILVQGGRQKRAIRPPNRAYFRGSVEGEPDSLAFLAVGESSDVRGLVISEGRAYVVGVERVAAPAEEPLVVHAVEEALAGEAVPGWRCANDALPGLAAAEGDELHAIFEEQLTAVTEAAAQYSIVVAIETDFELYNLFNSTHLAAAYIGDLLGATSAIYYRDVGTTLRINFISLWTSPSDPWTAINSCGTLVQFGNYWANPVNGRTTIPRATAHFLSGKAGATGIAWLGVLCAGNLPSSLDCDGDPVTPPSPTFSGGYGVSQGINGSFNPAAPTVVWDIDAVSHEIGHNFGSPHTHCYNGYPQPGDPPIDQCHGTEPGCYAGPPNLPAGGKGSIMSYCQLRPGGMSNIALSFGAAGLYGTQSERVPQRMRSHLQSRPPACTVVKDAPPADFNGDGRSEVVIYRNGAWLEFPFWPGN